MQEEEEAWRASHDLKETSTLAPGPSNNNQKPNENPGNGSTDENDDDNDDIIPGCYVLDIDNDALKIKRIWIRAEYIRIYDHLVEYYNQKTSQVSEKISPSVVITGQPGIGKSVWLYYALRRCLAERRPVILRYGIRPLLFVDDGVYYMRGAFDLVHYKRVLWTLVDADEDPAGVPREFVTQNTPFFVIYTASLATRRWSRLEKTTSNEVIVMNPWSRGEIHRAAELYSNSLDSNLIDDIYDRFGPIPRLCIKTAYGSAAWEKYEDRICAALEQLSLQSLQDMLFKLENLTMDGFTHKLCLVKRQSIDDVSSKPYVTYITDHIRSRMAIRMRNLSSIQQVDVYRTFACTSLRGAAGYIFESFCQLHFQKRILIDCVPMIQLSGYDGQCKRQWYTSHYHPFEDRNSETLRQNALRQAVALDIYPSAVKEYHDQDIQGLTPVPDVYYIPSTQNAVAVDSFIYHHEYLYLFQFTIADEHKINSKFMARFTQYAKFPPQSRWIFVFVVPDDVTVLTCSYQQSLKSQSLKLFSSTVVMEKYLKDLEEQKEESANKKQKRKAQPEQEEESANKKQKHKAQPEQEEESPNKKQKRKA